jgi:hypothetical protein
LIRWFCLLALPNFVLPVHPVGQGPQLGGNVLVDTFERPLHKYLLSAVGQTADFVTIFYLTVPLQGFSQGVRKHGKFGDSPKKRIFTNLLPPPSPVLKGNGLGLPKCLLGSRVWHCLRQLPKRLPRRPFGELSYCIKGTAGDPTAPVRLSVSFGLGEPGPGGYAGISSESKCQISNAALGESVADRTPARFPRTFDYS